MTKPNYYINFSNNEGKKIAEEIALLLTKGYKHVEGSDKRLSKLERAIKGEHVYLGAMDVDKLTNMLKSVCVSDDGQYAYLDCSGLVNISKSVVPLSNTNDIGYSIINYLRASMRNIVLAKENDTIRRSGRYNFAPIISRVLSDADKIGIRAFLSQFDDFNEKNNPYGERDFAFFNFLGEKCFFKIDYYNQDFTAYENPRSPKCRSVITIGLAEEY